MYDKRSRVGREVVCVCRCTCAMQRLDNRWQQRRGTNHHYFFVQGRNLAEFDDYVAPTTMLHLCQNLVNFNPKFVRSMMMCVFTFKI